jgi:hypothetical protein
MYVFNSHAITTEEAQKAANFCSGVNAPILSLVNQANWLKYRNEFLANVAYNGARSHNHIINGSHVLIQKLKSR